MSDESDETVEAPTLNLEINCDNETAACTICSLAAQKLRAARGTTNVKHREHLQPNADA